MELLFEYTIRMFLGEKASQIAGPVHDNKDRKKYFREVLKEILKQIDQIDTNTEHKEVLFNICQSVFDELKKKNLSDIKVSIKLLRLVGALLGYSGIQGVRLNTPFYFQTPDQHFTETIIRGENSLLSSIKSKGAITKRKEIIKQLKIEGMTYFEISLVLNTTEYQIKKLQNSR